MLKQNHTKQTQKGFTAVEALVILLIFSIVVAGAYRIFKAQEDSDSNNDTYVSQSDQNEIPISTSLQTQYDNATSVYPPNPTSIESEPNEDTEIYTVPNDWLKYSGQGFEFSYPPDWIGLEDLPDDWLPPKATSAEGIVIGGGFGPEITYSLSKDSWTISKLGKYPGERKVGDEFNLFFRTSDSGTKVYDYNAGDGPFRAFDLYFVIGENMVNIPLPSVCTDCETNSKYDSDEIIQFAGQISASVTVKE